VRHFTAGQTFVASRFSNGRGSVCTLASDPRDLDQSGATKWLCVRSVGVLRANEVQSISRDGRHAGVIAGVPVGAE
jgi:hypothetical protein